MALPLWGELEKAQDDPQTIEEAIAEAITNHNNDPEAHLGSGESLEEHKSETVIDHPLGSVVADKISNTEDIINIAFESLDAWDKSADGVVVSIGNGALIQNPDYPAEKFIASDLINYGDGWGHTGVDWLIQFTMVCTEDTPARFMTGASRYSGGNFLGVGFVWNGTQLLAIVKESTLNYTSSALSVDITVPHVYRVQYLSMTNTIYFFVDGVQVAAYDLDTYDGFLFETIQWRLLGADGGESHMRVSQLTLARQTE